MKIKEILVEYAHFLKQNLNQNCYNFLFDDEGGAIGDMFIWRDWCESLYNKLSENYVDGVWMTEALISFELESQYTASRNPESFFVKIPVEGGFNYDDFMQEVDNFGKVF